jgi:FKBP-type peptidyl-prolyl cis-trans isomerase (trigger factor)
LVLRKLAEDQGIDISPEEIQAEIDVMLGESGEAQESMRRVLGSDNAQESIRSSLLSRKVLRRLIEIVEGGSEETVSIEEAQPEIELDEEATGTESEVPEGNEEGGQA